MNIMNSQGDFAIPGSRPAVNIQAVLRLVYVWMTGGLLLTAGVAWIIGTNVSLMQFVMNPAISLASFFGTLGLVFVFSLGFSRKWMTPNLAMIFFFGYAALMGVLLSGIAFFVVNPELDGGSMSRAVVNALATTVALFGVMSLFGFTTKMDLTKWGTYLMIGVIGLLVAMIINLFLQSDGMSMLISMAGVVIFTALTAYDTQRIKAMTESYEVQADGNLALKFSILGALTLYLDFINLFLFLLRLFGSRD